MNMIYFAPQGVSETDIQFMLRRKEMARAFEDALNGIPADPTERRKILREGLEFWYGPSWREELPASLEFDF